MMNKCKSLIYGGEFTSKARFYVVTPPQSVTKKQINREKIVQFV